MTATAAGGSRRTARSKKARPVAAQQPELSPQAAEATAEQPEPAPAGGDAAGQLESFPPPTPWSEELCATNLRLAASRANRYAATTGVGYDQLYPVACMGLLKACRRFDPDLINPGTGAPYKLSTLAVPYIDGAIMQWLRYHGHSSGVRWPDAWRDKASIVRRLVGEGQSHEAVAEATGLPIADVGAILVAQGATRPCDPDAQGFATFDPEPADEMRVGPELQRALEIADDAHLSLSWADQRQLEGGWRWDARRFNLAPRPHGQFAIMARGIIRGVRLPSRQDQLDLSLEVPAGQPRRPGDASTARVTQPAEIARVVEQLALFGIGKADPEGGQVGSAPTSKPSDRQGQPAVVPPSAAG